MCGVRVCEKCHESLTVNAWDGSPEQLHAQVYVELRMTCTAQIFRALPCIYTWYFDPCNYIFSSLVAVLAVQVCAFVCVCVCLLPHCTTLHLYQQMLPKPPALSRLMSQRQVPEGKYVQCHMSLSWMAAFSMRHMPQSNLFNPETHTSPREPRAVLSSYVNYCMQCALTWL